MPSKQKLSKGEETLALHIRGVRLPEPVREYTFHQSRQWRFDFAWPDRKVAAEVEGLLPQGGRHQRMKGYSEDCEKYNQATRLGWQVYRFTPYQVAKGQAIAMLETVMRDGTPKDLERT